MLFIYGLLTATASIITVEIAFDYSLGDTFKDIFLNQEKRLHAQFARAQARYKAALAKLRKGLQAL